MGGQIFSPCNICTSAIRGGRISQRARDGGANMHMDVLYSTKSQEGDVVMHMDVLYSTKSQEGDVVMHMDGGANMH